MPKKTVKVSIRPSKIFIVAAIVAVAGFIYFAKLKIRW